MSTPNPDSAPSGHPYLVSLALRRPYTFIVMALLILLATPFALRNMATDIFPEIDIPVVSIIWTYNGLSAQEMGQRVANQTERGLTTTVSDIERIESVSLPGVTVIKIFFQPTANIQTAIAQVAAAVQPQVRQLPPGITPPLVIRYSASSVPVIQLALSSPTLPEQAVQAAGPVQRPTHPHQPAHRPAAHRNTFRRLVCHGCSKMLQAIRRYGFAMPQAGQVEHVHAKMLCQLRQHRLPDAAVHAPAMQQNQVRPLA